jgi:polyvinyl alcohol dehydrogenase (cytochrome)
MPLVTLAFEGIPMTDSMASLRWGALACSILLSNTGWTADWNSAGKDLKNSRWQSAEKQISSKTVGNLQLKWQFTTEGDVTANPAVDANFLYFPDSAGFLYKLRRDTGQLVWKFPVSKYTGFAGDFARATPAIAGDALILGNQSGKFLGTALGPQPAHVFAVNRNDGSAMWSTKVDDTLMSYITHSAIIAKGLAIVGVASNEELVAAFVPPEFWAWQFRGSVVAVDVLTGAIRWKTYMVPLGYYGGAVWGSTGSVDIKSNQVFMATGNNYMVPQSVLDCLSGGGTGPTCMSASNHFDSIVSMDLSTGAVRWAGRGLSEDVWSVACGLVTPGFVVGPWFPGVDGNCPNASPTMAGPDHDFAQGPMLLNDTNDDSMLVGAGQKSGKFWAFRARDGKPAWSTQVAPGGVTGGLQWGSASDGQRVYVAAANSGPSTNGGGVGALPWTLKDGTTTTAGGWAALDSKTGAVIWTAKDPQGSRAEAAVSGANGVIFGCNLHEVFGTMYALDAKTGQQLWSFNSGAPCNAGPSIADGMVYWGSGTFISPLGPKKLFAFGL